MSLFTLKHLQSLGFAGEEFDEKHLAIGRIAKLPGFALGSFAGNVRIFTLKSRQPFAVSEVYSNKFDSPVIDIKFILRLEESSRVSTIGVLLFKKFIFLTLTQQGGSNLASVVFEPNLLQVNVQPAFAIAVAPLCLMTLNSAIQHLNPPQLQPIKTSDPIYAFAQSLSKFYFMDGEELVELEGEIEQWRIIVGRVRSIFALDNRLILIGDKYLWEISESQIVKCKSMDEDISAGTVVVLLDKPNEEAYNILVASYSLQMFVYSRNYELLWAVRLEEVAVKILVCQFEEARGVLVMLSEEGNLSFGYTGTDMPEAVIETLSEKVDMGVVESETAKYLKEMRYKNSAGGVEQAANATASMQYKMAVKTTAEVSFKCQTEVIAVPAHLESKARYFSVSDKQIVRLTVELTVRASRSDLKELRVNLQLPSNIEIDPQSELTTRNSQQIRSKEAKKYTLHMYCSNEKFPFTTSVLLSVNYVECYTRRKQFQSIRIPLPMDFQTRLHAFEAISTSTHSLIIKSSCEFPSVVFWLIYFNKIFPGLVQQGPEQRKSLTVALANGVHTSITFNKSFNKAKVESEFYSGLCYPVVALAEHLKQLSTDSGSAPVAYLSVEIPLEEFFAFMKDHYDFRQKIKQSFKELEQKTNEFRNSQKYFLLKMKEKVSNVASINKLLDYTYERMIGAADAHEELLQEMEIINHNLEVAINFVFCLLFIRARPSQRARDIAVGIIGYETENLEEGWEEKIVRNSAHFLGKKTHRGESISLEQLQKIPLYVISKVNNGDWN